MKASEARSLAAVLLAAKREQEEKDIAPFLKDPEVESCLAKLYEVIRHDISQDPNCTTAIFPTAFTSDPLRRGALCRRFKDDGYIVIYQNSQGVGVSWEMKSWDKVLG